MENGSKTEEKDPYACPVCGGHHRAGTLVGFSNMNRKCADRWNRRVLRERAAKAEGGE